MKKIIVFGAAGFIGTYLIDELLKRGYEVLASDISEIGKVFYDDNKIPFVDVDITQKEDFERIEKNDFEAVIHLASNQPANVSVKKYDPVTYINVNVIGTLNILNFCIKNRVKKIIYVSSHRNTQALWKKNLAITEEDGRGQKFVGEYAMFSISESAAQDCVEYYDKQFGLKSIQFRLPPVYGYGPHTEIFKNGKPVITGFQTFIKNAMDCKPLEIWGDSSIGRDIIYVKDVVRAFIKALESDSARGLYNITSGKYLTLQEQVEISAKIFWGSDTEPIFIKIPEKPHQMDSFLYDNSKAKKELGWSPRYDFEDMLIDYKKEMKSKKFKYLIEKRKLLIEQG